MCLDYIYSIQRYKFVIVFEFFSIHYIKMIQSYSRFDEKDVSNFALNVSSNVIYISYFELWSKPI